MAVVAFLFDRSLPMTGGVAHSFVHLGRHAEAGRLDLHAVACQRTETDDPAAFEAAGIVPHCVGDRGYARPALALRRALARHRADVILCCSLKPFLLARLACLGLRTRVVFWHVAITDILDGRARRTIYRMLARRTDLVANSRATADSVHFAGHRGRTRVVHLGVPDAAPAPRSARQALLGLGEEAMIVAYTASFVAYKKHDVLLEAFGLLAPHFANLHLVLIGVGPLTDRVRARAAGLERVHFLGARGDVRQLLGCLDIYAHPAVGEGFGLAVVEAMLAGLPVVAASAGALPELIEGGTTGLLYAPDDAADLAACLRRLVVNEAERGSLGQAAREAARIRFAPETYAACLSSVLAEFARDA